MNTINYESKFTDKENLEYWCDSAKQWFDWYKAEKDEAKKAKYRESFYIAMRRVFKYLDDVEPDARNAFLDALIVRKAN